MSSQGTSKRKKRPSEVKCEQHRWKVLSESECIDCGESNPILLDFDHIDPNAKVDKISNLVSRGNYTNLVAEIAKCEIRCANCHRLKSAMDLRHYKGLIDWDNPEIVNKFMTPWRHLPLTVSGK